MVSTDPNDPFLPLVRSTIALSLLCRRPCVSRQKRTIAVQETAVARNQDPTLQPLQSSPHDAPPFLPFARQLFLLFPSSGFLSAKAYACDLKYRKHLIDLSRNMTTTRSCPPTGPEDKTLNLDAVISNHIRRVLEVANGRVHGKGGAAELLGINPSTLRCKMNQLGIPYGRKSVQ